MSTRDRAVSLLGQGFKESQVAIALGVTAGWISQLLDEDVVRTEVANLRANKLQAAAEADVTLDTLEKSALEVLKAKMPFVRSPMDAARIFSTLNAAKRKVVDATGGSDSAAGMVVNITLPQAATRSINITLNNENQVIDVEGRSMAPLPSRALATMNATPVEEAAVKSLPSMQDIRTETQKRLREADALRAAKVLENVKAVVTVINGVECVL